ncbi:MAG TPA: Rrf2 family transcriptional regulator [Candidatus Bathyarchaeia archaeon]|nr:Rrf2 family transcriptional regulator [Candidatus Bathyarchaeia archaeon]
MSTMLSITSQYALRALSHLARQPGRAVLGRDLAQSVEIPANYLSKVLLILRNAGLVDTTRGSGGGYQLGRAANDIHLIDVVELFEEVSRTKPPCFLGRTRACSETKPCTAHSTWKGLQAAYLRFLVSTPLSAIAGSPGDFWVSSEPDVSNAIESQDSNL